MTSSPRTRIFEIHLQGHPDAHRAGWFEEMTKTLKDAGNTVLTGQLADQSALYGLRRNQ